jgi:hypothetical protein
LATLVEITGGFKEFEKAFGVDYHSWNNGIIDLPNELESEEEGISKLVNELDGRWIIDTVENVEYIDGVRTIDKYFKVIKLKDRGN